MKSKFLIFTLFLAAMCIGSAGNAMAQSVTGTGVFNPGDGGPPATVTVSAQQGGSGGVMRIGQGQDEIIAHPVDICVNAFAGNPPTGNTAFVVAEITHASGDLGIEGFFLNFGFLDNGGSGDAILFTDPFFITPFQIPACDLVPILAIPVERGGYHINP